MGVVLIRYTFSMNLCAYDGCFDGKTVLVTGGAGFIGSHLTERLVNLGACVRVLDDYSSGHKENLQKVNAQCVEGSILDRSLMQQVTKDCEYIFHLAAFVSVPASLNQPALCHDVNVVGTQNVIDSAMHWGCKRIVFASSAACYGDSPRLPCREQDAVNPSSPYARSKCEAEILLNQIDESKQCDSVSLRFFNVFGEKQDANSSYAAVISAFAKAISNNERPVIYGDGMQTRDFIHVSNVVHATLLAVAYEEHHLGRILNVGTGQTMSLLGVLQSITGSKTLQVDFKPPRDGDMQHSCADISEIQTLLGFSVVTSTEQALQDLVNPTPESTHSHSQRCRK